MADVAVEVRDLTAGPPQARWLDGLSLEVKRGEVLGLVGPEGAGKSALLLVLNGAVVPSQGLVRVLGLDMDLERAELQQRVGLAFGDARGLRGRWDARRNLLALAELYELRGARARDRVDMLLGAVGLDGERPVAALPAAARARLGLAKALLHDPELLLLDEPTAGLGAEEVTAFGQALRDVRHTRTVLLAAREASQVAGLVDRAALMARGRVTTEVAGASLHEGVGA